MGAFLFVLSMLASASAFSKTLWEASGSCTRPGQVVFTFDDGVSKNYPSLLDILDRESIRAGFFVVGSMAYSTRMRGMLADAHKRGHMIMNHSWSHKNLAKLNLHELMKEITDTENMIREVSGVSHKVVRPPYGSIDARLHLRLQRMGYRVALWNLDSRDWDARISREQLLKVYADAFEKADPKKRSFVLLLHDSRLDSISLVPEIAGLARQRGFRIVPFDACFLEMQNQTGYH